MTTDLEARRALRAAQDARWAAIHAKIAELAIPDFDCRTVHLVSLDMAIPGWRVTRLDDRWPAGDTHANGFEAGIQAARDYGANMLRAVAVTPDR